MEPLVAKGVRDFSRDLYGNNWGINVEAPRIARSLNTTGIGASIAVYRSAWLVG